MSGLSENAELYRTLFDSIDAGFDARAAGELVLDAGQHVTICVSDTGTGIAKAHIDRVFDPFFTTRPLVVDELARRVTGLMQQPPE